MTLPLRYFLRLFVFEEEKYVPGLHVGGEKGRTGGRGKLRSCRRFCIVGSRGNRGGNPCVSVGRYVCCAAELCLLCLRHVFCSLSRLVSPVDDYSHKSKYISYLYK